MAKFASAGRMRTSIIIEDRTKEPNSESKGYFAEVWKNVFDVPAGKTNQAVFCQWKNAHGTESLEAYKYNLGDVATLTMRYSPLITPTCRIFKAEEKKKNKDTAIPFEIISIDDIDDRHEWLEVKIRRKTEAR